MIQTTAPIPTALAHPHPAGAQRRPALYARPPALGATCAGCVLLILSSVALAEESPDNGQLQEVVVTAQRKTENLQNASIAVDALKASDIASHGVTNPTDLQDLVPAVKFVAADQMLVQIRGLGTINANPGADSSVAYVQDGIFMSHPSAVTPVLFDLQRVEVVLGPQGTLYGRNTNAGAINFITNDPTFTFGGHASVGFGNYTAVNSDSAINIPLNDVWALRLAEGTQKHSAYDQDGSNNADDKAARVKLLYRPNAALKVLLSIDGAYHDAVGNMYGAICPPGTLDTACAGVPYVTYTGLLPTSQSQHNRDTIFGSSLDVEYDTGWAALTSLTGYRTHQFSSDTSPPWYGGYDHFDYVHHEGDRFITQELRLASEPQSNISWVAGLYYSNETQPAKVQFNYLDTILQAYGSPPDYFLRLTTASSLYQSEAAFGDVTVPLVADLRLRVGLRVTHESKASTGIEEDGTLGPPETLLGPATYNVGDETLTKPTWKLGLDYQLTAKNLLYFTASTGFKSGGVNNLPASAGLTTYAPETITAYQLGSKNRFLDDTLQVNAEIFHYDYKGYQDYLFYSPDAGPLAGATLFPTVNSQSATFEGGELNVDWRLTTADRIGFDLNALHDRFGQFVVALPYTAVFNLSGTAVPLAPRTTFDLRYEHQFRLPNADALTFSAISTLVSSHIVDGNYGANYTYTQPQYHKTDLDLSYATAQGGWLVTAYVRNLENKATINTIAGGYPVEQLVNLTVAMLDPPRTYGLRVAKEF